MKSKPKSFMDSKLNTKDSKQPDSNAALKQVIVKLISSESGQALINDLLQTFPELASLKKVVKDAAKSPAK